MPLPGRASGSILSPPVGWGGPRDCQLDLGFLTFIPEAGSPRAEFSQAPVYLAHRRGGGSGCDPRLGLFPEQPKKARRDAHNSNKNNNSLNVFKSTGPALRPLVRSLVSSSAWRRRTGREGSGSPEAVQAGHSETASSTGGPWLAGKGTAARCVKGTLREGTTAWGH